MIQRPAPGEIIAGIPGGGSLVSFHRLLKPLFRNTLARGEEASDDGHRCIRWDLGDRTPMAPNDPRRAVLTSEIRRAVESARRGAAALRALLDAGSRPQSVAVDADIMATLGRPRQAVMLGRQEAEVLCEVHRLAAIAVVGALEKGEFHADETGACLVGWGFLPPGADPLASTPELSVLLRADPVDPDGAWALHWECVGPVESVHLVRVRERGGEEGVREAAASGPRASGSWQLESSEAVPGARFRAVASGGGAHAASEYVEVPRPWVPPPALPEPEPEPFDLVEESEPDPPSGRRALWLLLLLPVALLVAWIVWLLFPGEATSQRDRVRLVSPVAPDWSRFRRDDAPEVVVRQIDLGGPPARERVLIFVEPRRAEDGR